MSIQARRKTGTANGVKNLQWLFTGTLFEILALGIPFAWLVQVFPRSRFIPRTYHFFALTILLFAGLAGGSVPNEVSHQRS